MYIYIKELKNDDELITNAKIPIFAKNIIIKFKKIFKIITIKNIDKYHKLYIIHKENKLKNIEKIIRKNRSSKIILSKELKKYDKQLNIKQENTKIKYFIFHILKYIMKKIEMEIELQNLYILANEYNKENIEIIEFLMDKVKTVNIITSNINRYKNIEERAYERQAALITISNNKNKALKRAKYIINLDFDNEILSQYKINTNSIIINCTNKKIDVLKYFQGIIINNIEITLKQSEKPKELYKEFDNIDIYESFEKEDIKYIENIRKIEENEVKIIKLIGNNGIINIKEISNIQKNIDKL